MSTHSRLRITSYGIFILGFLSGAALTVFAIRVFEQVIS